MNDPCDYKTSTVEDQINRIGTNLANIDEQKEEREKELDLRLEIAKTGGRILFYLGLIISLSGFFKGTIIEVLLTVAGILLSCWSGRWYRNTIKGKDE